ncbi:MAG: hypothetical protein GF390_03670 [Candidatus Pacebacteria bacterium]|nr:hypothetical protein [Candidatus Paceibacterota bacterium]
MRKLISIVGPTATGKTSLALFLAKQIFTKHAYAGVDLISADSRQLYQGLELITGADLPVNFYPQIANKLSFAFFSHQRQPINLHGVSIIKPNQAWSVAHFQDFAQEVMKWSWSQQRLPIVVGGTGLYHLHLFNTDPALRVKPQAKIRQQAAQLQVTELQDWLKKLDPNKFAQLNRSDRHNPRRLVRAIEIAQVQPAAQPRLITQLPDQLKLGLTASLTWLETKINQRVLKRLHQGVIEELQQLEQNYPDATKLALSATGIKELQDWLANKLSKKELITTWSLREFQYAKRQLTWWQKRTQVHWLRVDQTNHQDQAWNITDAWLKTRSTATTSS